MKQIILLVMALFMVGVVYGAINISTQDKALLKANGVNSIKVSKPKCDINMCWFWVDKVYYGVSTYKYYNMTYYIPRNDTEIQNAIDSKVEKYIKGKVKAIKLKLNQTDSKFKSQIVNI